MIEPVFIAGKGIISAIGNNVLQCSIALKNGRTGIGHMQYLQSVHQQNIPVAEVKLSNEALAQIAGLPATITRNALLSLIAAKEALMDAGIKNLDTLRTGFISGNSVGGMDKTEHFFEAFLQDNQQGKLREVLHHECGSISQIVADKLGLKDYVTTTSTACSSAANAIFFGARLIKNNLLDVVVAGGTDALTKFTLNGFKTLMILDEELCQPFDEHRRGLNLGEGAGYIVLVSAKIAATLSKKTNIVLSGYCNANDAFHQTASSPDGNGSYLAMSGALKKSGLLPSDIDYINLHGTGTQNNDIAEGTAISRLFEGNYPHMSSTKAYTGHTLGACGGVEAVFSVLAIEQGIVYPTLRLQTAMKDLPFIPVTKLIEKATINHVLSNSFGFGGNCTSLIFSKV